VKGRGKWGERIVCVKHIKHDLLDQLERKGTTGEHFIHVVDDHMG